MPQESKIPQENNSVLISLVDNEADVDFIADNCERIFRNKKKSLPLFQMTDFDYCRKLFKFISKGECEYPYFLCKFTDSKTKEIVGCVLFSIGSPWYAPKLNAISEELTVSFKKGYGIARSVAAYMSYFIKEGKADIATGASAQESCAGEVANSYAKVGYKQYPTYYMLSDKINNYNKQNNNE